ncbi:MAG: hypothetical protein OEV53_11150 [Nitrospira sp.]|nr:hypothetical protein [Nitrospira sp.]
MSEQDLEKLLGGFAAETLTAEEKEQLYQTALHDQALFNALADEQALKELLTDPTVRRRLLEALREASSADHRATSWLDWLRRPAGLAWAGGLAGAVLAVVLGTNLYQESLRQEAQLTVKEEARPSVPSSPIPASTQSATAPANEPSTTSQQKSRSSPPPLREGLTAKQPSKAPPSGTSPDERRIDRFERDATAPHAETATVHKQVQPSAEMLATSTDETSTSASQPIAPASPQSHAAATTPQSESGVESTLPLKERASLSARSLFHGAQPHGSDKSTTMDNRRREKVASESAQPPDQSEFAAQSLAMTKRKRASSLQAVGIRYSLASREQSEQTHDGAMDKAAPLELTVESNQDGFLQLWKQVGTAQPQLLFPISEAEQLRSKLTAHTQLTISVPSTLGRLVLRFSRTGTTSSATFDSRLLDDSSPGQLRESVMADDTSSFPLPIHYIVNQDPSLSEVIVHIAPRSDEQD